MTHRLLPSAIAFVCLLGATAPAEAQTTFRVNARLRGVQTADPRPDPRCAPPTVLVELSGEGTVSRLGRVTATASHCIIDDPAAPAFTDGEMTIVDDRGELFIEYSGTDVAGDLNGTWTVTGGTGDFVGASGGGTLTGTADPEGRRGVIRLDGSLTIP